MEDTRQPIEIDRSHEYDIDGETLDGIFRALTRQRRRYILYELQKSGTTDLETLATVTTATERGVSPKRADTDEVESTKAQLVHSDIPLLEDVGVVEYDRRSGGVSSPGAPPVLDALLQLCSAVDRP